MPLFQRKKDKKKPHASSRKPPSPESPGHSLNRMRYHEHSGFGRSPSASPNSSVQNVGVPYSSYSTKANGAMPKGIKREASVKDQIAEYERKTSPDKLRKVIGSSTSRERSLTSPPPSTSSQQGSQGSLLRPDTQSYGGSSYSSMSSPTTDQPATSTYTSSGFMSPVVDDVPSPDRLQVKSLDDCYLPLPPLQTATVRHRRVVAERNATGGGFGFILRQSYLPVADDPGKTRLVHLVEPRPDYTGPLMTGDRIIEVGGEQVEDAAHERVVELIKSSGDSVELQVASMPELLELNARVFQGTDNPFIERGNKLRKSGKMKPGATGTLRKQGARAKREFKAKSLEEVLSEKKGLEQERVWIVHRHGFSLGTIQHDPSVSDNLPSHYSIIRYQGKEMQRVKLDDSDEILEVDEAELEKANPPYQDSVEDLVDLTHLNESSVLHVLRQRYGSSLIHTFAGRHLIVLNPLRPLSCYVDRVIDMFRGCRREDMPPHIFAAGQQAYRSMMVSKSDQSLILMGLSGSGKTFNARYLLRYLATVGQPENGPVTNAKLDAVELLLHSFGSAATFLNPQATRCTCLYTLDFDPSGSVVSAQVRTYLLEKTRVAYHPEGEGNFNIIYQLISGADEELTSELMLDALPGEEPNLYVKPHEDPQRIESAAYVWDLIQNCLEILGISEDEAMGLWSLLAAIYHLGYAGVKKSSVRGSECFLNPAAALRAAVILGIDHEDLGKDIFNPPRGFSLRTSSTLFSSPSQSSSLNLSDTGSIHSYGSPIIAALSGNRSAALDAFVMGLYEQALSALVMMINRALLGSGGSKARSSIHVLDTPGFQHRELAGARNGASFDDLCMNYNQERLHMLFHDVTFTSEQDRCIQENIDWMFSEFPESPLPVIDAIDKHVMRRGVAVDLNTDRRGLLWILEEESVFPGASDGSFLDRIHMYHGKSSEAGEKPLIKVMKDENQFLIRHCQKSLPVLYDANGWVKRAREHPSFRVVAQVMADSKKECIGSIFQGRGVAASATTISTSSLKADMAHSTITRSRSTLNYSSPSGGVKKSSICLQTKFQLDSLIDVLRKTHQWFIRCILPQASYKLPGALPSPDPSLKRDSEPAPPGVVDIPLIRTQIQRADIVKAARIYKQGFPDHVSFPEFCRRYGTLERLDVPLNTKDAVQQLLMLQEVPSQSYRLGLSQAFFRRGILIGLDQKVELRTHDTMVLFQARCRGYLGRKRFEQLELLDSAAYVIQSNVAVWMEIRDWSWWKLYSKIKPMLAIWRVERETKEKQSEIDKLKVKVSKLENERDMLQESESVLNERVKQLSVQTDAAQETANQAEELLESEQLEKRAMEEQLHELTAHEKETFQEKEQLNLQIAEMSILARIKQEEGAQGEEEGYLEKYWETKRELETLRQRLSSERDDELETLRAAKRSLDKKLAGSEAEVEELNRSLGQLRKKTAKQGQELNDLKLHLESQQSRNAELEKRQRKFDTDLNSAKDGVDSERQLKERLAREKDSIKTDLAELQARVKELEEENKHIRQEKEDMQAELLLQTSTATESELTSVRKMKRELESKLEGLEDELDEANLKVDNLQQTKARLEVANQTLKSQHQKELEARDEEVEEIKNTSSKKVKAMADQIEELHEEKRQAVKSRRDMERELAQYQGRMGDPEVEKKLRKQIHKLKALLQSNNEELERLRDSSKTSALVRSLRNQLEELQANDQATVKSLKRVQEELDENIVQNDELTRNKMELETKASELTREKSDLESRVDEDQEEIEELTGRQRALISQTTQLQTQLSEANARNADLEEANSVLDGKVSDLNAKLVEMESGVNRHQYEVSEVKVRELEQKLELERSSARRLENQIQRLRGQLERAHKQEGDEASQKSSEALRRMQKQLREVRVELQEAERKEQETIRKKRALESQVQELEVRLQNSEADLRTAERRIETLQDALKGQEEDYGSGEEEGDLMGRSLTASLDDLSSSGGSYQLGEYREMGSVENLSNVEDSLSTHLGGRSVTPKVEDYTPASYRPYRYSPREEGEEEGGVEAYRSRKRVTPDAVDDFPTRRERAKQSEEEDEEGEGSKMRKRSYLSKDQDEDDDLLRTSTSRKEKSVELGSDEDITSKRYENDGEAVPRNGRASKRRNQIKLSDEDDDEYLSWKQRREAERKLRGKSPEEDEEEVLETTRRRYRFMEEDEDEKAKKSSLLGSSATSDRSKDRICDEEKKPLSSYTATTSTEKRLSNGTTSPKSSVAGNPKEEDKEAETKRNKSRQRNTSIVEMVSEEQEQLYSQAQKRRRRRRTGDANSSRQTTQDGSTL